MLLGQNLGGADARRWPLSPLLSVLEASVALLRSWIPTAQPTDTGAETETNAERTQVYLSIYRHGRYGRQPERARWPLGREVGAADGVLDTPVRVKPATALLRRRAPAVALVRGPDETSRQGYDLTASVRGSLIESRKRDFWDPAESLSHDQKKLLCSLPNKLPYPFPSMLVGVFFLNFVVTVRQPLGRWERTNLAGDTGYFLEGVHLYHQCRIISWSTREACTARIPLSFSSLFIHHPA
jgi:hypothetical protein